MCLLKYIYILQQPQLYELRQQKSLTCKIQFECANMFERYIYIYI